jgi:molybdopterin synthase sulfur carrier subunit
MKLLYFAWLRAKIGTSEETIELPPDITTVGHLLEWLKRRGPRFSDTLQDTSVVRVAVNQDYVPWDHPVRAGDEVALFPPVTGG